MKGKQMVKPRTRFGFLWRLALTGALLLSCRAAAGELPGISEINGSGTIITENRPVADFDMVTIRGTGIVYLSQGTQPSLAVSADDNLIEFISTEVQGRTLVLDLTEAGRTKNLDPSRPFEFDLVVVNLEGVRIAGSADLRGSTLTTGILDLTIDGSGDMLFDAVTTTNLDLSINGSGNMQVGTAEIDDLAVRIGGSGDIELANLLGNRIEADIFGSGNIELAGEVTGQEIKIVGSGDYRARELASRTAEVRITGSGSVTVWVLELLDITIPGSGDVQYYGDPQVTQSITGSGDVRRRGEP